VFRVDRGDSHGGSAILIPTEISCALVSEPVANHDFECICLDIFPKGSETNFRLINIYRPHKDRPTKALVKQLTKLIDVSKGVIIVGDFNLPGIDWDNLRTKQGSVPSESTLLDFFVGTGLSQHVTQPTRGEAILDLVLSNEDFLVSNVSVDEPPIVSDHRMTVCQTGYFPAPSDQKQTFRNFRKADYRGMERFLDSVEWPLIFANSTNVHQMWAAFMSIMTLVMNLYVPPGVSRPKKGTKLDSAARKLRNKQWKLRKKFKRTQSQADFIKWQEANRLAKEAIRRCELEQESAVINGGSEKSLWSWVKSRLTCKPKIPSLVGQNGQFQCEDAGKARALLDQFTSVFTNDDGISLNLPPPPPGAPLLSSITFSPVDVYIVLSQLPNKTSSGPDEIPQCLLKNLAFHLALPLCTIFNTSLATNQLPNDFLLANVTAIFKKGLHSDPSNYRPISITSAVCRVFERLVKSKMIDYFLANGVISRAQHGFLSKRSTVTQLLECTNDWTKSLASRLPVDVIYLDIQKAFDSISYQKLIEKLRHYGISGDLLSWIGAYLTNRNHRVRVDQTFSDYDPVTSGVPQGSVLGPLLFLIYINDLPSVTRHSTVKMFADDSKLYFTAKTTENRQCLQEDLDRIHEWATVHQLALAVQKCTVLHLGATNPNQAYSLNGTQLPENEVCVRDLGVLVSKDLRFSEHCSKISNQAQIKLNMIFNSFRNRNIPFLVKLYQSFVRSRLEYAIQVWNPIIKRDIDIIESVQRQFTHRLPGIGWLHYEERRAVCGLEILELRRLHSDLVFVYKMIHKLVDLDFDDFFEFAPKVGTRGHPLKLFVRHAVPLCLQGFFSHRVVKAWNNLSTECVSATSVENFQTKVKRENLSQFLKGSRL